MTHFKKHIRHWENKQKHTFTHMSQTKPTVHVPKQVKKYIANNYRLQQDIVDPVLLPAVAATNPIISANTNADVIPTQTNNVYTQRAGQSKNVPSSLKYAYQLDIADYYFSRSPQNTIFGRGFMPFIQNPNNVLYADVRGLLKQPGSAKEGNLGLGFRHLNNANNKMYGAYMFFDRNKSTSGAFFSQLTFGAEVWLDRFFLGANFYYPIGKRYQTITNTSYSASLQSVSATTFNILVTSTQNSSTNVAMIGGDITAAYQPTNSLTGYVGGFYFHSASSQFKLPIMIGPMARLRYSIYAKDKKKWGYIDELSFETQIQYDQIRKTVWYGGLRLTFAFNGSKLNRMQQHMVDPALRDIDVVSNNNKSTSASTTFAKNSNGQSTVIKRTDNSTFNAAVGDSTVDVIAVSGIVTNANQSGATLATGQTVTGGMYVFNFNGQQLTAQVSTGGELRSTSAATNMLKLGKNNTVRDITLTMVSPTNANGSNIAIIADAAVNDLGTVTIDNVTSTGIISIPRSGAAQSATVVISDSTFNTGTSWAPTNLPAVGQFNIDTNSTLKLTVTDSTFSSNGPQQVVGLRAQAASNSAITITEITNNTIDGSDGGLVLGMPGGNITVSGNIENNTIDGGNSFQSGETGLLVFHFGNIATTFTMNGTIKNNTIKGTDEGLVFTNFGGTAQPIFNVPNGIINNRITAGPDYGIEIDPVNASNGIVSLTNLYGNSITTTDPSKGILINGSHTTIQVGDGSTGLSVANGGTPVSITNGATVLPGA
ncbi:MAG TPA: inverse autotransporter beta domain-containing protein [Gammaproteobacteria bacterium]|nr:inverse autotransporter beta domain-containing protein [Gammaproteobacteria bacterium]